MAAQGFASSYEQLTKLKIPVLLYIKHRKDDHFSVLRGISENIVWLADPSLGNITYSKEQFLSMWQTRKEENNSNLKGKFLVILPSIDNIHSSQDFFSREPKRQSMEAIKQLRFKYLP